jgi:hypothetical protein
MYDYNLQDNPGLNNKSYNFYLKSIQLFLYFYLNKNYYLRSYGLFSKGNFIFRNFKYENKRLSTFKIVYFYKFDTFVKKTYSNN